MKYKKEDKRIESVKERKSERGVKKGKDDNLNLILCICKSTSSTELIPGNSVRCVPLSFIHLPLVVHWIALKIHGHNRGVFLQRSGQFARTPIVNAVGGQAQTVG